MTDEWEILIKSLDRFSQEEVEGRALSEPPEHWKAKLRDFARGQLPEAQRGDLINQLKQNPSWIALLVTEAKALRASSPER